MTDHPDTTAARTRTGPVLAIILASYLMIVLDISITITALPQMRADLGFSDTGLSWVQSAYTLAFGGLLLLGARAGDIVGRRRMFVAGITVFSLASLLIALAPTPAWLIAARVVQGVGAAVVAPSTLALLSAHFDGAARTRAIAWYGAVAGIGASLGLVLGGVLTSLVSWRVGFLINVPLGLLLVLAAPRYLAGTRPQPGRFDLTGALTSTVGMSALVYGIVRSADAGWADTVTSGALAVGAVLLAAFVVTEARAGQPIVPLRLFADRERVGAYTGRLLFLGAMMGFWFFTTQYLQDVHGDSPLTAGLAFLPMSVVNFAVALLVPRLTTRFGNPRLLAVGLVVTLLGMAWLSRLSVDTDYLTGIALPMILVGAGQGAALSPLTASGIVRVSPADAGAASGVVNVAHQLGGSLGLGVLVTIVAGTVGGDVTGGPARLAEGVSTALTAGSGMLAIALLLVVALVVRRAPRALVANATGALALPTAGAGPR